MMITQEYLWLASYALGLTTTQFMAKENFSPEENAKINSLIKRRENHEPMQYIMGIADFYGRDFEVGTGVLIPRHDTETLIDAVKEIFSPDSEFIFLDWGTGSGCIAVTLLLEFKSSFAFMLDKSNAALNYSEKNLSRFNVQNRAKLITDINEISLTAVTCLPVCTGRHRQRQASLDLIISNPPYIPSGEIKNLMPEVKDYEPLSALDGGGDGMDFYRLIFSQARNILRPGKYLIFEAGDAEQVQKLKTFFSSENNFTFINQILDTGSFPRALIFKKNM